VNRGKRCADKSNEGRAMPISGNVVQTRSGMLLHVDPWSKAAECDRAIERVADPERRTVLESLRSFWIELGNELPTAGGRHGADSTTSRIHPQLSTITQIHTQLMAGCRSAMH
jgi:hypothetical protein